tara:strand:- start:5364 stop:6017 length:654 start_codon:yes stop_codon:yes gene_type:complete
MIVHIATMGDSSTLVDGYNYHKNIDKFYILTSKEFSKNIPKLDTKIILKNIDPFKVESTINMVIQIVENEKDSDIYINVTGGTNAMAAGALSAAYYTGTKAYYVLNDKKLKKKIPLKNKIIELPVPNIPYLRKLKKKQLYWLFKLNKKIIESKVDSITQKQLAEGRKPQVLTSHIRSLEKVGLIKINKEKGHRNLSLTNEGRLFVGWYGNFKYMKHI